MNRKRFIGAQFMVLALLIGVGYFYTSLNPLQLYDGKTFDEWSWISSRIETHNPTTIITWQGSEGQYRELETTFNAGLFTNILIYGMCLNLFVTGFYFIRNR